MPAAKKLAPVKCFYCNQTFDRNTTEYVAVRSRRYAHKSCADAHNESMSQEEHDLEVLQNYIKKLFKIDKLSAKINSQIKDYHENRQYSYRDIYKSLLYFYDVKQNPIEKANNGIGIVPYVYDDAKNYYLAIWMAQQQNIAKPIEQYKPNTIEIHIPPPVKQPIKNNQFSFLEEGVE